MLKLRKFSIDPEDVVVRATRIHVHSSTKMTKHVSDQLEVSKKDSRSLPTGKDNILVARHLDGNKSIKLRIETYLTCLIVPLNLKSKVGTQ